MTEALLSGLAASPDVYVQKIDLARGAVLLVQLNENAYRAASFLDDRILTPGLKGAWASLENGGYAFTITHVQTDDRGAPVRRMLVEGTLVLDEGAERFTAQFKVRGLMPDGQVLFTSEPIAAVATRIHAPDVSSALEATSLMR